MLGAHTKALLTVPDNKGISLSDCLVAMHYLVNNRFGAPVLFSLQHDFDIFHNNNSRGETFAFVPPVFVNLFLSFNRVVSLNFSPSSNMFSIL